MAAAVWSDHAGFWVLMLCACSASAVASTCSSVPTAMIGGWTVATNPGHHEDCTRTWTYTENAGAYVRLDCDTAGSFGPTSILQATCTSNGDGGALSGTLFELDSSIPGGAYIYCSYWHKDEPEEPLFNEWWYSNNTAQDCPPTLAEARAKPTNGEEWFTAGLDSGTCGEGMTCGQFECGCTTVTEDVGSASRLASGMFAAVLPVMAFWQALRMN